MFVYVCCRYLKDVNNQTSANAQQGTASSRVVSPVPHRCIVSGIFVFEFTRNFCYKRSDDCQSWLGYLIEILVSGEVFSLDVNGFYGYRKLVSAED